MEIHGFVNYYSCMNVVAKMKIYLDIYNLRGFISFYLFTCSNFIQLNK